MTERSARALVVNAWKTCFHCNMPDELCGMVEAMVEEQLEAILPEIICAMAHCCGVDDARVQYEAVLRKAARAHAAASDSP